MAPLPAQCSVRRGKNTAGLETEEAEDKNLARGTKQATIVLMLIEVLPVEDEDENVSDEKDSAGGRVFH